MIGDLAPLRIACSIFPSSISLLVRRFRPKIKICHIGNKDCRQGGQLQYRKIMSFWAKKQGFLPKLPKGGDQKAGMMTFLRVATCLQSIAALVEGQHSEHEHHPGPS